MKFVLATNSSDADSNTNAQTTPAVHSSDLGNRIAELYTSEVQRPQTQTVCPVCQQAYDVQESDHLSSIPHQLALMRRHHQEEEQAAVVPMPKPKPQFALNSGPGFDIMRRSMNWQPYCDATADTAARPGLGRESQGRLYPVATVLKLDRTGLGYAQRRPERTKIARSGPFRRDKLDHIMNARQRGVSTLPAAVIGGTPATQVDSMLLAAALAAAPNRSAAAAASSSTPPVAKITHTHAEIEAARRVAVLKSNKPHAKTQSGARAAKRALEQEQRQSARWREYFNL
ncbi:E3 ubiquitin-protein ligase trim23 [Sorochytrium milnesiophthora]